ncbi:MULTISPECIES: NUDIX domain-containing protein [unclassified Plantactinospora]|uniref:NUDIX domain-containing protein n=1 Tax=unclassified Plantactinospora TaxID=2631981 RepID=UPI000D161716|nr:MULTISPECIES: NUDIX domain-containing protein [unclassified Plantactinospora]AVT31367.1 NUDIX hydrolase [Plantactinospora sp. BC1]AVT39902.1 NUDIX hydrolase [Plantactinospora sp. BB1]
MPIPPYVARLRAAVGSELLLLPSASVLPVDPAGRLLLVRHRGHTEGWGLVGGVVEPGESPAEAAVREAAEEIGVRVRLTGLLDVLGGPEYEVTYPHGDRAAYVTAVYRAEIVTGTPVPDGDEVGEVGWFGRTELAALPLSRFARAVLRTTGYLAGPSGHLGGSSGHQQR